MQWRKVVKNWWRCFLFLPLICQLKEQAVYLFSVPASQIFCSYLSITLMYSGTHPGNDKARLLPLWLFYVLLEIFLLNFIVQCHSLDLVLWNFLSRLFSELYIFLLSIHNNFRKLPEPLICFPEMHLFWHYLRLYLLSS